jgi:pilus assembly protein Flp/PilA
MGARLNFAALLVEFEMKTILKRFHGEESGASLVEYGLLVGLIAVAAIAAVRLLGGSISGMFTNLQSEIDQAAT